MQGIEEQKLASLSRELIKVTHKRRDLTQPTNYRPLCAMQSLYKVRVLKSLTSVVSEKLQSDRPHVHRRGTKQGDPLMSLLFNWVLQQALESQTKIWREQEPGKKK